MEPRREEQQKALEPSAAQKPKRFRIVKLEERIAPKKGGGGNVTQHKTCNCVGPTAIGCTIGCCWIGQTEW